MWFTSPSHNRQSSISGERRRAHGSPRRRTGFRPKTKALDERCLLSTLTVTNANDSGVGSLRAEIAAANAKKSDTIVFAPSLDGQTITLTSGELYINKSLTISGPGAAHLTISGGNTTRVFEVAAENQVALSGLTISNGNGAAWGGGILNYGKLTVTSSTLSSNSSHDGGGAIFNDGSTTISNCTLSGNTASEAGGGGAIFNNGSMTISNSTLSGNTAAPYFDGTFVSGGDGGAIYDDGSLSLSNSTLSDNSAPYGRGSAIYMARQFSNVTVSGCTLTDSANGSGTLIWVDGGTLTVKNSYFHNGGADIYGPYTDGGGNTFA
jgi:parallel beta-helix repeat protein